jgi:pantetheine-phosphate adenylyltransferase
MSPRPAKPSKEAKVKATRPAAPASPASRPATTAAKPATTAAKKRPAKAEATSAPQGSAKSRVLNNRLAVYPGTFDPITNGHLDILERALRLFDRVMVTLAVNPRKQPLFTVDERIAFIQGALPEHRDRLEFASFDGLLVDFVQTHGATTVVRGLRALADFEYEFQFAHMNRRLAPGVDTIFFMTDERNHYVSSSLVKEVASLGGDVTGLVPPSVVEALSKKYGHTPPGPGRGRRSRSD